MPISNELILAEGRSVLSKAWYYDTYLENMGLWFLYKELFKRELPRWCVAHVDTAIAELGLNNLTLDFFGIRGRANGKSASIRFVKEIAEVSVKDEFKNDCPDIHRENPWVSNFWARFNSYDKDEYKTFKLMTLERLRYSTRRMNSKIKEFAGYEYRPYPSKTFAKKLLHKRKLIIWEDYHHSDLSPIQEGMLRVYEYTGSPLKNFWDTIKKNTCNGPYSHYPYQY